MWAVSKTAHASWPHPGLKCTAVTYNACISACACGAAWPWALWLFGQMTLQGPLPWWKFHGYLELGSK
jgi:hypothetical protein